MSALFSRRVLILSLLGLLVYSNSLFNPFVHDDWIFIRFNPRISDLTDWPAVFLSTQAKPLGPDIVNSYYRPFLEIIYRLLYRLFGFHPLGYHAFNVFVHISNGVLVFFVLRIIFSQVFKDTDSKNPYSLLHPDILAWFIAIVFIVHPVQTEAVACISGMSNLIFSFFCLSSLLVYLRPSLKRPSGIRHSFSLFLFLLALLVKEQAIFFPLLVLACDFILSDSQKTRRTKWFHGWGFVLTALLYLVWRQTILGVNVSSFLKYKGELLLRLAAIPSTLLMYMRVLLFPCDLHYYRSINILDPRGASDIVLFCSILLVTFVVLRHLPKGEKSIAFLGLLWFILALSPVLNFIPIIHEYSWIAAFEHFLYLPLIGFFIFCAIILGHGIAMVLVTKKNRVCISLAALVIIVYSTTTVFQNNIWQNELILFKRAVRFEDKIGRLRILLAKAYLSKGDYVQAQAHLQKAADIMAAYLMKVRMPQVQEIYLNYLREIYLLLAYSYEAQGNYPKVIDSYEQMIPIVSRAQDIYKRIGLSYYKRKDYDQAIDYFLKGLSRDKNDVVTMNNLALCYIQKGDYQKAERLLKQALDIQGDYTTAQENLRQLQETFLKEPVY